MRRWLLQASTGDKRLAFACTKRAFCTHLLNPDINHLPHSLSHTRTNNSSATRQSHSHEFAHLSAHLYTRPIAAALYSARYHSTLSPALSPPLPPTQPTTSTPTTTSTSTTTSSTRPRLPCPHCTKSFATRESYIVHQIEVHNVPPPPAANSKHTHFCQPCPYCHRPIRQSHAAAAAHQSAHG